jgi:hypothetical protein
MAASKRIEVNEADLREFIEAAEEVRDEAVCMLPTPGESPPLNALYHQTENRFALALDALKFDLDQARA